MSFFKGIKRALGFGSDVDSEYDELLADTAESVAAPAPAGTAPAAADTPVEFDPDVRAHIFDKVVEIFTAALPDFMAKTVDGKTQREYLMAALDRDTREYIDNLTKAADAHARSMWESRQAALSAELDAVRQKSADLEKQSSDTRQKQLSADRQKRALSDRVHDLESTIARLEAEREQFELENCSLINRLKVANVHQDELDSVRAEAQRLRAELTRVQENPGEAAAQQVRELNDRIAEMGAGIESLKEQLRVSNDMLDDQRQRLAAAQQSEADARAQLDEANKKLDEANKLIEGYSELAKRLEDLDKALTARDAKIKSQKQLLASRDAEIASLRQTVSENIRLQAEREKALKAEIETLRPAASGVAEPAESYEVALSESPAPRISESDLSDIEKTFETEDWFTKTPPPETPSMRSPEAEAEFGYHPPKRRNSQPHNPDQLSLF